MADVALARLQRSRDLIAAESRPLQPLNQGQLARFNGAAT